MGRVEEKSGSVEAAGKPLAAEEAEQLARQTPRWSLEDKAIRRQFVFKDFREAMDFVNDVADLAEDQGHHPDIMVSYNKVQLTLTTHKVGGLSRSDFVLAAKVDRLLEEEEKE